MLLPPLLSCWPLLAAPAGRAASPALWERLERRQLDKPIFNAPPAEQAYPDWLLGSWRATASFAGYAFPSTRLSKARVVADVSTPGFQKLSIAYLPDVGATDVNYRVLFERRTPSGPVTEARAANLASLVDSYTRGRTVDSVEYEPTRNANRLTIRLVRGATVNAERIELFSNARESALRDDGVFFAAEALRQVTLGYTTQFNTPRVAVTDYQHVWSYRLLPDGAVRCTLSTAGYIQPNEALAGTAAPGAPPQLGSLLAVSTEPVVLYSHVISLARDGLSV